MDKDKEVSAVDKFLGELGNEGEKNPFQENTEDPFAQEAEVKEESVEEVKEEKPLPFHKDPKLQRFIDKEVEKKLSQYQPKVEPAKETQNDDDYWERLIGNDTPEKVAMVREAKAREQRLLDQAVERTDSRLTAREQEALKADQEAQQELDQAFENIEETFDVDITSNNSLAKKTRQEFVSFVEKIAPKDRNGDIVDYPDMTSAWETFQEIKKSTATSSRAKELASRGMARSSEAVSVQPKKATWDAADEFISSLK